MRTVDNVRPERSSRWSARELAAGIDPMALPDTEMSAVSARVALTETAVSPRTPLKVLARMTMGLSPPVRSRAHRCRRSGSPA
jgi:hypothetical protein